MDWKKVEQVGGMVVSYGQSPSRAQNFWICTEFCAFAQNAQNFAQKFWTNFRGYPLKNIGGFELF